MCEFYLKMKVISMPKIHQTVVLSIIYFGSETLRALGRDTAQKPSDDCGRLKQSEVIGRLISGEIFAMRSAVAPHILQLSATTILL